MATTESDIDQLFKKQLELEERMIHKGLDRYHKTTNKSKESGNESLTVYGKKLLKTSIDKFEAAIDKEFKQNLSTRGATPFARKLCEDIDTRTLAVIATKKIIDGISFKRKRTGLVIKLGGKVEDEAYFRAYEQFNKTLFKTVDKDLNSRSNNYEYRRYKQLKQSQRSGFTWNHWTVNDKTHVGSTLLELFILSTGFCRLEKVNDNKVRHNFRQDTYVTPTDKLLEWIDKCNEFNEYLDPEYLPTVIIPRPWKKGMSQGAGYIHERIRPIMLVTGHNITSHRNYLKELELADMPGVIDGINAVQNTMYKINKDVYWTAEAIYRDDKFNQGSPIVTSAHMDLPNKPHDIDTNPKALSKWKAEATIIHTLNAKLRSKRLQTAKILHVAKEYMDYDQIGFPCNLDFRSRLYYVPAFLNPQGNDLAKSLLRFAEKKPIGSEGYKWLCIHIANCYGYDKVSLDDRIKWVEDNHDMILESAHDPINGDRTWMKADKPFQFLAASIEYNRVKRYGLEYESDLPIHIDGSCNGLQHFSAMLRDQEGGIATNLTDTETPEDIYQIVCDKVIDKLKQSDDPLAKLWLAFGIDRKATKRSVMVLPYGGTRYSSVEFIDEYLADRIEKGDHNPFDNRGEACKFLGYMIYDSIGDTVSKAREAMAWLQKIAKMVAKLNSAVEWETPLGFPIRQAYYDTTDLVVRTKMMGRIRVRSTTDKINKRKQANGISANLIHSLDATCLYLSIDHAREKGVTSFSMVHDSYGTHACDVAAMGESTRAAFIELYGSNDPLEMLRDQLIKLLPEKDHKKIPDLPSKGDLDLNNLKKAKYFFC